MYVYVYACVCFKKDDMSFSSIRILRKYVRVTIFKQKSLTHSIAKSERAKEREREIESDSEREQEVWQLFCNC